MSGQVGKIARRRTGVGGTGVVRGPADDCLAGVVQAHLRRFHRHGGENPFSQLDAQTVRRMVASSIFTPHGLWTFVSGLLATFWQGEFLWHRQPLASPVVDAIYAISSVGFVGWRDRAGFTFRDRVATTGALVRLWQCRRGDGVLGVPVHHLRFSRLLLSVERHPISRRDG